MIRKLQNEDDKTMLRKFRSTYKLSIKSLETFKRYKNARKFIIDKFDKHNERTIRTVIFKRPAEVVAAIKDKYDNVGTQNSFISSYKVIYDRKGLGGENPYASVLDDIRQTIREQPHPNTQAKELRTAVKDGFDTFTEGLWASIDARLAELNTWIKQTYDVEDIDAFNAKYKRTFNNDAKLNIDVCLTRPGAQKFVNQARSILAVSLQAGTNHVLRAEHRTLRFYRYGGQPVQNFYSKREKKIFLNDYKTVKTHGLKIYRVRELDDKLIRFIRVFSTSNYIFTTKTGNPVNAKAFIRYYSRIQPGMTPTKLRKILIDTATKAFPDTGNSERVRREYYTINEDGEHSQPAEPAEPHDPCDD